MSDTEIYNKYKIKIKKLQMIVDLNDISNIEDYISGSIYSDIMFKFKKIAYIKDELYKLKTSNDRLIFIKCIPDAIFIDYLSFGEIIKNFYKQNDDKSLKVFIKLYRKEIQLFLYETCNDYMKPNIKIREILHKYDNTILA